MTIQACGGSYPTDIRSTNPLIYCGEMKTKNALYSEWQSWAENASSEESENR